MALLGLALFAVMASIRVPVRAQPAVDVQLLVPSAGRSSAITIPELELPPHGTLRLSAAANYARKPWVRELECPASSQSSTPLCPPGAAPYSRMVLMPHMTQLELAAALALYEALQLGVALPVVWSSALDDFTQPREFLNRSGLGDMRLSLDAPLLSGTTTVGLSLLVSLPTGDPTTGAAQPAFSVRPALIASQRLSSLRFSLLFAYRMRRHVQLEELDYDDELEFGLGAAAAVVGPLEGRAELRARLGVGGRSLAAAKNPVELDAAAVYHATRALSLSLGGGAGIWPGLRGYGAPTFRVFGSASFEIAAVPCAFGPEDHDGYQDHDSCRDPDNDRDGLPDVREACPNDAEDRDGFEDQDGCPDSDNDADGLLDAADRCPRRSEDRDGFEDRDGCPEPDNDGDGLLDALDGCPLDPEDRDQFEDGDGCPEPGPTPLAVRIDERRILVSERIYFDDGHDTIREVSRPVLDQVAAVIRGLRPELKVIVEGHTDDAGTPAHNLDLSHRRARAVVEYLRGRGVPPSQLDYVGHGATKPLGPNDSPEGRALNRRVEFTIAH